MHLQPYRRRWTVKGPYSAPRPANKPESGQQAVRPVYCNERNFWQNTHPSTSVSPATLGTSNKIPAHYKPWQIYANFLQHITTAFRAMQIFFFKIVSNHQPKNVTHWKNIRNWISQSGCKINLLIAYMLYAFFWVFPRRLNFICRRFGTQCSIFTPTCLWRWNSVPKRRHIKFRRRGITHKKENNIQNKAKVWNQEYIHICKNVGRW